MATKKKKSREQPAERPADSPHPALKLRHTLRGHTGAVYRMALSPDGRTLASPSEDKTVRLWDVESGRGLKTLEHQAAVVCVGWSPDGTTLAAGTDNDRKVCLWDAATGRQIRILEGHGGWVEGVAWSRDGKTLASGSAASTWVEPRRSPQTSTMSWTSHAGPQSGSARRGFIPSSTSWRRWWGSRWTMS